VKILSLDLIAFGPFTNVGLDLSAGREGLHLVYGANEAGKSSALRGLRQLLYGIPERSTDGFVHPFTRMRVGGKLRSASGEVLELVRRKGRGSTLRAADDQTAIADSAFETFLNGVDAGLFSTMFGIGYEDLVAGGRAIVRGGGDLGRLIFAAGSGVADLGAVLEGLQAEADALFRPAGQKQKINEAVVRLKQRRSELKEAQLPGQEWARHELALSNALRAKDAVEAQLADAQRRLSRLQRIQEAHPVIAGRREAMKALESVADAAILPDGFAERRADALTRLRVSQSERRQAAANLAGLARAISEVPDPSALLGHAESIEGVHQDLGSQRKAARDRIALEIRRNALRSEARQILRSLREDLAIEEAGPLRIKKPEAVRIQELGAEYERVVTRIDAVREKVPEQERALAAVEARLQALPRPRPVDGLRRRLAEAEEALPMEKQLAGLQVQIRDLLHACTQSKARLGLNAASLADVSRSAAPSIETARVFEDRWDELDRRLALLAEEVRKAEADLAETGRRLDEARLAQEVPGEADLAAARDARDRGWRLIRRMVQGEAVGAEEVESFTASYPGAGSLPEAFEAGLRRADETADRLRREAERVAAKARLLSDQAALRARLVKLGAETAAAQAEKETLAAGWADAWQPLSIVPRSPREMRQWLSDFNALAEKAGEVLKREWEAAEWTKALDGACANLRLCLQAFAAPLDREETLSALIRGARNVIAEEDGLRRQAEELARERERRVGELDTAHARLKLFEEDLRRWQMQWEEAVRPLGLGPGTRPAEANAVMEELKSFFDKLREAEVLQQRVAGIDRDAGAFRSSVTALTRAVGPDLAERPVEEAAAELQRRLTAGRQALSKRQALQKQIDQEQAKLSRAEGESAEIESVLGAMCTAAGCQRIDELPEAERRSLQRRQLEDRLRQDEDRLLLLSGGAGLEEFINAAAAVDPDGIEGDVERLNAEIGRLTAEKSELDQRIGSERTELGRMDGGDKAALIAGEIQSIMAALEREVEHYARLKIAGRVLALAMERFRERSQGPILRKASGLFQRITCGSFEGLRADHDPGGNPVLVGVRKQGRETVAVEGMSDGTADQLYLSLRLAGLEHYLEANEPMPFIVDDILIKFDNARAAAALQALAELSKKTQVIFFTHHRHLLELAAKNLPASVLIAHQLESSLAAAREPPGAGEGS
jgi:uncharacterized protein YhaN